MKLKKNDKVIVIAGKDKGKTGVITSTDKVKNRVIVEGINIRTYHKKPTQVNPEGGIIKQEASIDVSNVMIADGKKNVVVSRIGYKIEVDPKTGKKTKTRFLKKNNQEI